MKELESIIDRMYLDSSVFVVIITGSGDKAFASGADIEMQRLTEDKARELAQYFQHVFNKLEKLPQPTICAVNGYALGGWQNGYGL